MALHVRSNEMQDGSIVVDADQGGLSTRSVYGNQVSMTVATREPGYHSIPHYHAIEQLTYVVSGETWMFIGNHGFIARHGDFFRVPSGEVHWSWNTGGQPLVTFQCFAPVLDPETNDGGRRALRRRRDARRPRPRTQHHAAGRGAPPGARAPRHGRRLPDCAMTAPTHVALGGTVGLLARELELCAVTPEETVIVYSDESGRPELFEGFCHRRATARRHRAAAARPAPSRGRPAARVLTTGGRRRAPRSNVRCRWPTSSSTSPAGASFTPGRTTSWPPAHESCAPANRCAAWRRCSRRPR